MLTKIEVLEKFFLFALRCGSQYRKDDFPAMAHQLAWRVLDLLESIELRELEKQLKELAVHQELEGLNSED
jgi:hypothetical protein